MYKLFLTLRYLRKRRIAYFAILAVTLCVAMVLIVLSIMGGFLDMIKFRARGLLGDVVIDGSYLGFPLYDEFIAEIEPWPEIVKATPVVYTAGLLRLSPAATTPVRVAGIRLHDVYEINSFKSGLYYEKHYPGTTSFEPARQPLLGYALDEPVTPAGPGRTELIPRLALPPEFETARERARQAKVQDSDTVETELNRVLAEAGQKPIAGIFDISTGVGTPEYAGEPRPGMIIGRDIIAVRTADGKFERSPRYPRGFELTVTVAPIGPAGTLDMPVTQPFRYADDSRTGIYEIDSNYVYCDFALLQRLLKWDAAPRDLDDPNAGMFPGRCSQIQIKIDHAKVPDETARRALTERLRKTYYDMAASERYQLTPLEMQLAEAVEAKTWEQSQEHIIAPVEKERIMMTILFGIISLVAVVLILCILYMIALQKTRDIGIIKSIGGSSTGVATIFVLYGLAVGFVGGIAGAVLGYLFVTNINEIQEALIKVNPAWRVWDRSVYSFDEIPSTVRAMDLVAVVVVALLAATIGSFAAAWRAGRMHPVEALRYE